tara:strand:+ start:289 stop:396 length:108 start_codon:yes stop_codon:yes gene_type:complete
MYGQDDVFLIVALAGLFGFLTVAMILEWVIERRRK